MGAHNRINSGKIVYNDLQIICCIRFVSIKLTYIAKAIEKGQTDYKLSVFIQRWMSLILVAEATAAAALI